MTGLPKGPNELRQFLHGYRIKNPGRTGAPKAARASIIIGCLDAGKVTPMMRRAAEELAKLSPALAWLPGWKPRASVRLANGDR